MLSPMYLDGWKRLSLSSVLLFPFALDLRDANKVWGWLVANRKKEFFAIVVNDLVPEDSDTDTSESQ